jgi:hypothetical protein
LPRATRGPRGSTRRSSASCPRSPGRPSRSSCRAERRCTSCGATTRRNDEGESGVDLLLASGDGVHSLGSFEGHVSWPGLSWAECSEIAGHASNLTPAEALIVLFPFVGDELGPTAVEVLASALSRLGVSPDRAFIEQLISAADARDQLAQPGPAWADRDGATTFLGRNSSRGPASPADFRRLVDRCLGAERT